MTIAIGGSPSTTLPPHGALWVNVRNFGAKGDRGVTDNTAAIQAAVDSLASQVNNGPTSPKGIVFIPSSPGTYVVSDTIWVDSPNVEIWGEGWGSIVQMSLPFKKNVFMFGLKRVDSVSGQTVQIGATHRPDCFGVLDTSVVTATGQKWGIRTNTDSWAQFQASPLSSGSSSAICGYCSDYWLETPQQTWEFIIEPPSGQQFPLYTPLVGIGFYAYNPRITVGTGGNPGDIWVTFRTSEMDPGYNTGNRWFVFSTSGFSPPFRIAIQIDLTNAVCSAFVNGIQVPFTTTANLTSTSTYPFVPGLKFMQNDYFPFMIGANDVRGPLGGSTGLDMQLFGLRISNTIRYQNNGAGKAQTRADNPSAAVNDAYAYFTNDNNVIAFLPLNDNPATALRNVSVQHGQLLAYSGVGSGIFMQCANSGGILGNAVRNLQIIPSNGHGIAIAIGNVLEMEIDNVKAVGGFQAIGSWNMEANYNVYVQDCFLHGYDAPYYGFWQFVHGTNIVCLGSGKSTIRLVGCSSAWDYVMVGSAAPNAETIFKAIDSGYGGNHSLENFEVDFEGNTLSLAAIYCEAHAYAPATSLELKDIYLGTVGSGTSLVMLKDRSQLSGSYNRCWLSVENLQAYTNDYLAAIDVDGPLWHGEVKGVALGGPQFNHRQKWGTNTNIVIRDTKYVAPPRTFLWYDGAHVLETRSPADNQFAEWRCTATGTYGTPTPPRWVGLNPVSMTPNGLAAYVLNHCYITANL